MLLCLRRHKMLEGDVLLKRGKIHMHSVKPFRLWLETHLLELCVVLNVANLVFLLEPPQIFSVTESYMTSGEERQQNQ